MVVCSSIYTRYWARVHVAAHSLSYVDLPQHHNKRRGVRTEIARIVIDQAHNHPHLRVELVVDSRWDRDHLRQSFAPAPRHVARSIATRYDKLAGDFQAANKLVATLYRIRWIRL
jgi:hypothetical protein